VTRTARGRFPPAVADPTLGAAACQCGPRREGSCLPSRSPGCRDGVAIRGVGPRGGGTNRVESLSAMPPPGSTWGESGENTGGNGREWRGTVAGRRRVSILSDATKTQSRRQLLAAVPCHSMPCDGAMIETPLSLQNRYSRVRFPPAPLAKPLTDSALREAATAPGGRFRISVCPEASALPRRALDPAPAWLLRSADRLEAARRPRSLSCR
jgi:hypothetical protein